MRPGPSKATVALKERQWTELVSFMQHGHCVLVLGPEVRVASDPGARGGAPSSGQTYADSLAQYLTDELRAEGKLVGDARLTAVAQQYQDDQDFGTNSLRAQAARFCSSDMLKPSSDHDLLAALPLRLVLSTTHDSLLERALKAQHKSCSPVRYHFRGDRRDNAELSHLGSPEAPVIYHLFGDALEPSSMVLSENDLLDFLVAVVSSNPPLPNGLIRALQQAGTFVFVGFGIHHWYLRVLLKVLVRALDLHRSASRIATESLASLPPADLEQTVLFYQRGARVQVCDQPIDAFLTELHARLRAAGGYLGPTEYAGPRPKVFISYASEDAPIASQIFATLQSASFDPWFDQAALQGGDRWDQTIEEGLKESDFVLVVHSAALSRKRDSYVNKELALARRRALEVRGSFLIPLRTDDLTPEQRISELSEYQEVPLRGGHYADNLKQVISLMTREIQRRRRG